ncbi:MAG: DUF2520 domain-containing protein [Bacteroidaceae bacterium]|nr:DUF2520 domain-containing protein [Bacteroidaceae bacterium]
MRIALVGAGNLATNLGGALVKAGHTVCQVYSRTQESADALAVRLGSRGVSHLEEVVTDAQLYIVALKDSALDEVLPTLLDGRSQALWVHTAGSVPMSIWPGYGLRHYGVLYPMQTFSKAREVDFTEIPFFLEASGKMEMDILRDIASSVSHRVYEADSEQRRYLHLSAVFACNFTNAMYNASARLLEEHGLSFEVMLPLIDETARKVHVLHPVEAQTGPAVRYDRNVIDKHLAMLDGHSLYQQLYELTSRVINAEINEKTNGNKCR